MTTLSNDLAFAVRTLRKSPGFAVTAIVTIALGIGATTAIFSVVNAVLLRSLPYAEQDRLVFVQSDLTARNVNDFPFPPGDIPDLRRDGTQFAEVAGLTTARQAVTNDAGEPEITDVANVTTNFFRTIGARIAKGRDFVDADGAVPAPPPQVAVAPGTPQRGNAPGGPPPQAAAPQQPPPPIIVVLSDGLWKRRFGSDPNIVGKTFHIGRGSAEIVGVLEPGIELLWPPSSNIIRRPELYSALRVDFDNGSRTNVFLRLLARLRPGVTVQQAQAQVNGIVTDLRKRFPVKETAGLRWRVEPMQQYLTADVRPALLALMGSVVFVLLIACANVANLLLIRMSQRERELAVRAALGSNRFALVRQMLVESLVISGTGAVLGLLLAWGGIRALIALGPATLPRLDEISLDPIVLAFAVASAVLSALIFGVVPALRASRVDVADILRSAGRHSGLASGRWLRNAVVVTEVALAFVLLVGSGLMMRSFVSLYRADPGFDAKGVLTFQIPNLGRPSPDERATLIRTINQRLEAIPGVKGVTAASPLPLENVASNLRWGTEAAVADPTQFQQADFRTIQPNYFTVARTRLLDGRLFADADNAPALNRIIIDDVLAKKAFPGQSAVGKRILSRVNGPEPEWFEIIGVVQQQRNTSPASQSRETIYFVDGQLGFGATNRWLVRTDGDPLRVAQAVRSEIKQLDHTLAIADLQPMNVFVDRARAPTRFALACIGLFAIIAGVLASVGLYGVLSTSVRQRTAELGVRMAFGASANSIFALLLRQGAVLSGTGIAIGLVAAFALTRAMRTMLVGVQSTDPLTFAAIALLFFVVALMACWIPARRAAGLEPVVALRED